MSKPDLTPTSAGNGGEPRLSRASVARFSLYLRHLERFHREGVQTVSSGQLGVALGITDAQVRKDLACLGNLGQPGIGYPAQELMAALRVRLGLDRQWAAVVVGVGNLARALLRYRGFERQGFRFVALFDADETKIGQVVDDLEIHPIERMDEIIHKTGAELGVVAVPAEAAQNVANALVGAGIRGILNFAPTVLHLPAGVSLVAVDLAIQLQQLAFRVHLGQEKPEPHCRHNSCVPPIDALPPSPTINLLILPRAVSGSGLASQAMDAAITKADILIEALSYIRKFRDKLSVIKLGGSAMEDPEVLKATLQDVVFMETVGMRPVLVHGGGKPIDRAMAEAGLKPRKVQGRRITDEETLAIVVRVLLQEINADIERQIRDLGGRAVGPHLGSLQYLFGEKLTADGRRGRADRSGARRPRDARGCRFDPRLLCRRGGTGDCVAGHRRGRRLAQRQCRHRRRRGCLSAPG